MPQTEGCSSKRTKKLFAMCDNEKSNAIQCRHFAMSATFDQRVDRIIQRPILGLRIGIVRLESPAFSITYHR